MVINEFHIFLIALPTLCYDCSFIDLLFAVWFDQLELLAFKYANRILKSHNTLLFVTKSLMW